MIWNMLLGGVRVVLIVLMNTYSMLTLLIQIFTHFNWSRFQILQLIRDDVFILSDILIRFVVSERSQSNWWCFCEITIICVHRRYKPCKCMTCIQQFLGFFLLGPL